MRLRNYWSTDFPSSIVVFLVALPLCLGIALASGAPLFAGLLAGIIGGILVGSLSGSQLSVCGPAAGLVSIVALAILELGSFEAFLLSVVLAGILQLLLGYLKAGTIGHFFPAVVIKGMLAGIGLIIILKQIPHAVGFDVDFEGDENFLQSDGRNSLTEIVESLYYIKPGAVVISLVSILILILWESNRLKRYKFFQFIPGPLGVVVLGILISLFFKGYVPTMIIEPSHLVSVPLLSESDGLTSAFIFPDFSAWQNPKVYYTAITIAVVASLETLLGIAACDKLDPHRRITPLDRELKVQGLANLLCGLVGGLPVTSVIDRSSANIKSGAQSRASAVAQGAILLAAVLLIPGILELIPLACLAGILIVVGYKLANPSLYRSLYSKGLSQFLPFVVTALAVLFTNLLQGVFMGMLVAIFFILRSNHKTAIIMVSDDNSYLIKFSKDVSFLNKANLRRKLQAIPNKSQVMIDGSQTHFIDADIRETIEDYVKEALAKNIQVDLKKITL
jgi:MFS superfamily sulfate permease-like transporter